MKKLDKIYIKGVNIMEADGKELRKLANIIYPKKAGDYEIRVREQIWFDLLEMVSKNEGKIVEKITEEYPKEAVAVVQSMWENERPKTALRAVDIFKRRIGKNKVKYNELAKLWGVSTGTVRISFETSKRWIKRWAIKKYKEEA